MASTINQVTSCCAHLWCRSVLGSPSETDTAYCTQNHYIPTTFSLYRQSNKKHNVREVRSQLPCSGQPIKENKPPSWFHHMSCPINHWRRQNGQRGTTSANTLRLTHCTLIIWCNKSSVYSKGRIVELGYPWGTPKCGQTSVFGSPTFSKLTQLEGNPWSSLKDNYQFPITASYTTITLATPYHMQHRYRVQLLAPTSAGEMPTQVATPPYDLSPNPIPKTKMGIRGLSTPNPKSTSY